MCFIYAEIFENMLSGGLEVSFSIFLTIFFHPKNYDKLDDFDFDIVSFHCLDGDVPRRTCISYGVYISQHIRFASVCNNLSDFNTRKKA